MHLQSLAENSILPKALVWRMEGLHNAGGVREPIALGSDHGNDAAAEYIGPVTSTMPRQTVLFAAFRLGHANPLVNQKFKLMEE